MADARRFVYRELHKHDLSLGLDGLPAEDREAVRDLMCFYDNLGAIVAYDVIDVDPVVGYIGGSVTDMWTALEPLIASERRIRQVSDPSRWHVYFEELVNVVRAHPPVLSRVRQRPRRRFLVRHPRGSSSPSGSSIQSAPGAGPRGLCRTADHVITRRAWQ